VNDLHVLFVSAVFSAYTKQKKADTVPVLLFPFLLWYTIFYAQLGRCFM
jgi:hypothetical protein